MKVSAERLQAIKRSMARKKVYLSKQQVFQFDLRMAVLTLFVRLLTVRADSLLRTSMNARKAHSTTVADEGDLNGFASRLENYIVHRTDTHASTTAGTLVGIHFRTQEMDHASRHSRTTKEP